MPIDRKTYKDPAWPPRIPAPDLLNGKESLLTRADPFLGPLRGAFFWAFFRRESEPPVFSGDGRRVVYYDPRWNFRVLDPESHRWINTGLYLVDSTRKAYADLDERFLRWLSFASPHSPRYRDEKAHTLSVMRREYDAQDAEANKDDAKREAMIHDAGPTRIKAALLRNAGVPESIVRHEVGSDRIARATAKDVGAE